MPVKARKPPFSWMIKQPLFLRGLGFGAILTASIAVCADTYAKRNKRSEQAKIVDRSTEQDIDVAQVSELTNEDINKLNRGYEILKYGYPDQGHGIRYYGNHILVYDQQKKIPFWVAEHLTTDLLKGPANRKQAKFKPDPGIDEAFTAQNTDYWKSGWSRGHMVPAGDSKFHQEAMNETFYLSNVVPQNYENNAGFWNRFEIYCRELTSRYPSVYVVSGPLMLPEILEDGTKLVKYQVIGNNNVAVPTHLFKVVIVENKKSQPIAMGAFVVPNQPIGYEHPLREYQVELQDLEKLTGIRMSPKLDRKSVKDLCKVDGCKLMNRNQFELYITGKKLESANTVHRLETVWGELKEKNLKPDKYLKDLYARKQAELVKTETSESSNS